MDRRSLAFNGQVADRALEGRVAAARFVTPERRQLTRNVWLARTPGGAIDREYLYGDAFDVIEERGAHSFGRAVKDGYVGWVPSDALGPAEVPTHWVARRSTWAYAAPDIKSAPVQALHMTSRVTVTEIANGWATIGLSTLFVPSDHLTEMGTPMDQVAAARAFLGTPYVWAGNSGFGIDCSGLVQVSAHAAGLACAADSDQQEAMAGDKLPTDVPLEAGDLVFWRGHVALATGAGTLIHANAYHMTVVEEPIAPTMSRIAATDTGPVTSILRPQLSSFW